MIENNNNGQVNIPESHKTISFWAARCVQLIILIVEVADHKAFTSPIRENVTPEVSMWTAGYCLIAVEIREPVPFVKPLNVQRHGACLRWCFKRFTCGTE